MTTSGESEQALTRYLLGEASEEEREHIEEKLFTDREFFEQVETVEMRLVDRYVLEEMSADERERFISHYLPAPEHARRVREAQQFHKHLKTFGSEEPDSDAGESNNPSPVAWAARFGAPVFVAMSLAAVGAFIGAGAWLLARQSSDFAINGNDNQILIIRASPSPPQPATPVPAPAMLTAQPTVYAARASAPKPRAALPSSPRVKHSEWCPRSSPPF